MTVPIGEQLSPGAHARTAAARTVEAASEPLRLGRRGFVGALAGSLASVGAAVRMPAAGMNAALPQEVARRARASAAGTAFDEVSVQLGDLSFTALLPRDSPARQDTVWAFGSGPDASTAAAAGLDAGMAVIAPPSDADERDVARIFDWADENLRVDSSCVLAIGAGAPGACDTVADRVLPRIAGLYLISPSGIDAVGHAVYWRGRRIRAVSRAGLDPQAAAALEAVHGEALELTIATVPSPAADLAATLRRWRVASR